MICLFKMVIFYSYVKLPKGTSNITRSFWPMNIKHLIFFQTAPSPVQLQDGLGLGGLATILLAGTTSINSGNRLSFLQDPVTFPYPQNPLQHHTPHSKDSSPIFLPPHSERLRFQLSRWLNSKFHG